MNVSDSNYDSWIAQYFDGETKLEGVIDVIVTIKIGKTELGLIFLRKSSYFIGIVEEELKCSYSKCISAKSWD